MVFPERNFQQSKIPFNGSRRKSYLCHRYKQVKLLIPEGSARLYSSEYFFHP